MTMCAPAARHFLVHASAEALAPLAPHLSSDTHPLTVVLFPISSNASADRASRKNTERQIAKTFLMAGFSFFKFKLRSHTPQDHSTSKISHPRPIVSLRQVEYTTARNEDCHLRDKTMPASCIVANRGPIFLR